MKILGLDIGTNSVGWCHLESRSDEGKLLIKTGVYVFPEPGELEYGLFESFRKKRGEKRRQRRNLRRKRYRRDALVKLLVPLGLLPEEKTVRIDLLCKHTDDTGSPVHPYALRKKAIEECLNLHDIGKVFYHMCKRRGYLSTALLKLKDIFDLTQIDEEYEESENSDIELSEETRQIQEKRKQEGPSIKRINTVYEELKKTGCRTIGELMAKRLEESKHVRGYGKTVTKTIEKDGKKTKKVVSKHPERIEADRKEFGHGASEKTLALGVRTDRIMLEREFNLIWEFQSKHYPDLLNDELKEKIKKIIFDQRPLKSQKHLVGYCSFIPTRKRIPRASLLFQRTSILEHLNNLRITTPDGEWRKLNAEEVNLLANELEKRDAISWDDAKQLLKITEDSFFSDEQSTSSTIRKRKGKSTRGKSNIKGNQTAFAMRKAIGDKWDSLSGNEKEDLITRLTTCREYKNIVRRLKKDFDLDDDDIKALAKVNLPEGYGKHCHKVLRTIEPFLKQGLDYYQACIKAKYINPNESTEPKIENPVDKLSPAQDLRNPIVQRAVQCAIKVINAYIDKYGKPDKIRIELPRDVARTNKQKEELWKQQDANAKKRANAVKLLEENKQQVNEKNIKKILLWEEAGQVCPYFPKQPVTSISTLIEEYDIDHIVPRSVCFDDSWINLTICPRSENTERKSRLTPFEAYSSNQDRWHEIKVHVRKLKAMPKGKKERLLKHWRKEDFDEFTNNALSDTRYINKYIYDEIKKLGVEVEITKGRITNWLRKDWNLNDCIPISEEEKKALKEWREKPVKKTEKPRFDHRHHALDAIITALTNKNTLNNLTKRIKQFESGKRRKDVQQSLPWDSIASDLKQILNNCLVVYEPARGIQGALHNDTARKPPSEKEVSEALENLSKKKNKHFRNCLIVGKQLVVLNDEDVAFKAYDLSENHHAVIWETQVKGKLEREVEVVSMMEAAHRALCKEPIIQKNKPGYRYVMSLCKNDVVEWDSEDGSKPELYRVTSVFANANGSPDIFLRNIYKTRANEGHKRSAQGLQLRISNKARLMNIKRRVMFDPIGNAIGQEPKDLND